jgi:hypothetical protein
MNTTELDKIDRYRHLLPDPAPQVVGQLIEEVRSMREAIREAHAALSQLDHARIFCCDSMDIDNYTTDDCATARAKLQPFLK